uniref:Uncharacterized protein n=1 Tax=Rhizophora mucronata TaxID=61149 RepID=A0A2P2JN67_RHIMU
MLKDKQIECLTCTPELVLKKRESQDASPHPFTLIKRK